MRTMSDWRRRSSMNVCGKRTVRGYELSDLHGGPATSSVPAVKKLVNTGGYFPTSFHRTVSIVIFPLAEVRLRILFDEADHDTSRPLHSYAGNYQFVVLSRIKYNKLHPKAHTLVAAGVDSHVNSRLVMRRIIIVHTELPHCSRANRADRS